MLLELILKILAFWGLVFGAVEFKFWFEDIRDKRDNYNNKQPNISNASYRKDERRC